MFEKVIKILSRTLAAIVVFLLVDGFYLSQKGFVIENGRIFLATEAQAADKKQEEPKSIDTTAFQMDLPFVLGNEDAPITIYEFSSLGCTHCADFHLDTLPKIKKEFIESGKVKVVFAEFPIDSKSMKAAMLARCMPKDKYFDFLSTLFKKQLSWGLSFKTEKILASYAEAEGMPVEDANACMNNNAIASEIMYVRQQAMEKLGIIATPSFLVRSAKGEELITGAPSYEALSNLINNFLAD